VTVAAQTVIDVDQGWGHVLDGTSKVLLQSNKSHKMCRIMKTLSLSVYNPRPSTGGLQCQHVHVKSKALARSSLKPTQSFATCQKQPQD